MRGWHMTPSEWIFAAFVVLTGIHLFVPSARSGIVSIYDAGMFAIYLIVLAWELQESLTVSGPGDGA